MRIVPAQRLFLTSVVFAQTFAAQSTPEQTAAIRALEQAEARRESRLAGYTVTEHYKVASTRFGQSAEMTVETVYRRDQGKTYKVLSRSGSTTLQSRVFDRLLREEGEMSRGESRRRLLVNEGNYGMKYVGEEARAGRKCYVLELTPRVKSPHLLKGRAWIDAEDGYLVRLEGKPTASSSFLSGRPMITREYTKVGEFWLAQTSHAVSDTFLLGKSELTIEYRDYRIVESGEHP
jgi:negative regulator of sigma E activity